MTIDTKNRCEKCKRAKQLISVEENTKTKVNLKKVKGYAWCNIIKQVVITNGFACEYFKNILNNEEETH